MRSPKARVAALVDNLSIRHKFLLVPCIMLLAIAGSAAIVSGILRSQRASLQRFNEQQIQKTLDLSALYSQLTINQIQIFDLLIAARRRAVDERTLYEHGKLALDTIATLARRTAALADTYGLSAAERSRLGALEEALARYRAAVVSAVRLSTVDLDRSFETMATANGHYREVDEAFDALLRQSRSRTAEAMTAALARTRWQVVGTAVVGAVIILALTVLSLLVSRVLSRPILQVADRIRRVAEDGDLDETIPVSSSDEVAHLARNFNAMIRSLRETTISRDWLEVLLGSIADGVIATDAAARVVFMNAVAEASTAWPLAEAKGRHVDEVVRLLDQRGRQPLESPVHVALREGRACETGQALLIARDGREIMSDETAAPIRTREGILEGAVLVVRDVTRRHEMELQLRSAQKLEAIGQLAAGIAHEINTPTQYVSDNLRFLGEAFANVTKVARAATRLLEAVQQGRAETSLVAELGRVCDEADLEFLAAETPAAIGQALDGIERIAEIVGAMKEFSHPGGREATPVDLRRVISNTITVARNEWKCVAEVEVTCDDGLPMVSCYPGELNQVLLNLVVNAAHAIRDKLGDRDAAKGRIVLEARRAEGDRVEIRVSDTGAGIPETIRDRVFDPFFTTREVGKGTGQGLAIAYSVIVDKHGGTLHFESKVGEGTTFVIGLPVDQRMPADREAARPGEAPAPSA